MGWTGLARYFRNPNYEDLITRTGCGFYKCEKLIKIYQQQNFKTPDDR